MIDIIILILLSPVIFAGIVVLIVTDIFLAIQIYKIIKYLFKKGKDE
jgi:Gpi18-like mannosyltransferase